jgi:transcriptional regulator NrdR family protein
MIDSQLIKAREAELNQKMRVTKICEDCDGTFETFELSIGKMTHMHKFSKQRSMEKKELKSEL